jgi:hypothetical protein
LKRFGFSEPTGVAHYEQEVPLGETPDFVAIAKLLPTTFHEVYGAREGGCNGFDYAFGHQRQNKTRSPQAAQLTASGKRFRLTK